MRFHKLGLGCVLIASAIGQTRVDLRTQSKSVDFSAASSTKPSQTGTALPATCSVGQTFLNTAAPAGQNWYACTSVNTWALQGGGGITSVFGRTGAVTAQSGDYSAAQVSGLAPSATTDTTNASNISSGTLGAGRLPTPGTATLGGVQSKDCSAGGQFLQKINADGTETCGTPAGGGNVSGPGTVTSGYLPQWGASNNLLTTGLAVSTTAAANTVPEAGAGGTLAAGWLPGGGSHTVNTTAPLSGGGSVALGGTLTLACPTCLTAAPVPSVFGRTGAVTAQSGDYSAAQITGLAPSATTDTTNAANITSGTLPWVRLPVPGSAALGGVQSKNCSAGGQFLQSINTDGSETCNTPAGGGNVSGPGTVINGYLAAWGASNNLLTTGLPVSTTAAANTVAEAGTGGTLAAGWLPSGGSHTVNTTAPLSGGGSVALGGTLTLSCPTCLTAAPVPSVFGRTGAVTAQSGDYSAAQISGLAASATTDTTNAANISSGTLATGRLPTAASMLTYLQVQFANAFSQKLFGSGVPGSVSGNEPGDEYFDTTNGNQYGCLKPAGTSPPACTAVGTGNWTLLNGSGGGGAVSSVFGRTGAVTAQSGDYSYAQISGTPALYNQTLGIGGTSQTQRGRINLIQGSNVTISAADNSSTGSTDVTISASGGGSSGLADPGANGIVARTAAGTTAAVTLTAGSGITIANGTGSGNPLIGLDTTVAVTQAQAQTLAPLMCAGTIDLAFPTNYDCTMSPPPGGFLDANNNPLTLQFCPATSWGGGKVNVNTGLAAKRLLLYGYDPPAGALLGGSCYRLIYNSTATVDGVANVGAFELKSLPGVGPYLYLPNAGTTGTTLNKLTKLTGAPSSAVSAATTDTGGVLGITVAGAGTTLTAVVQVNGNTSCVFDGATTAGDYVQISSGTAGDCHDAGASYPTSGQVIGRALSTNAGTGTYGIQLFGAEVRPGGSGSGSVTSVATTGPISGGTITTSGTISCPTCVTSAASLTNNAVVLGGGGQAASTIAADTTTTHALFATAGAPAFRALATTDLPGSGAATVNGQNCTLGQSCNVNSGAAAHSVALNEGAGAAVGGAAIGTAGRLLIDQGAGVDPSFNAMSGDATITNSGALTIAANAVTSAKMAVANTRRTCTMVVGADNGPALGNADIGPQGRQCFVPAAATVVEITIAANNGTPSVLVRKNHAGTPTNLTSAAFATAASGGLACANAAGSGPGIDGATTCTTAIATTALAAGDWLELGSGTADGVASRMSINVTYTLN